MPDYGIFSMYRLQVEACTPLLKHISYDFAVKFDFIILSPADYDDKDTARSYGTSYSKGDHKKSG
jgi:hypothetical protein